MATSDNDDDGAVGYARPPKKNQFKKGQSGNPKGRPKSAKGLAASLRRELDARITAREGGRTITMSKAEAAAKRLMEKAIKGDLTALKVVLNFDRSTREKAGADADTEASSAIADAQDLAMLRHYFTVVEPADTPSQNEGDDDVDNIS